MTCVQPRHPLTTTADLVALGRSEDFAEAPGRQEHESRRRERLGRTGWWIIIECQLESAYASLSQCTEAHSDSSCAHSRHVRWKTCTIVVLAWLGIMQAQLSCMLFTKCSSNHASITIVHAFHQSRHCDAWCLSFSGSGPASCWWRVESCARRLACALQFRTLGLEDLRIYSYRLEDQKQQEHLLGPLSKGELVHRRKDTAVLLDQLQRFLFRFDSFWATVKSQSNPQWSE